MFLSVTARLFSGSAPVDAVAIAWSCRSHLAALVADRAVERVVDEQELHHAFAAFCGPWAALVNDPAARRSGRALVAHLLGAGRDRLRPPFTSTRHMRQLPAIDRRS